MDSANEDLSKRLHKVLNGIGASECTRKKWCELAMLYEILFTFKRQFYENQNSFYVVGSTYEGTTTPGLDSDIDILVCDKDSHAVNNLEELNQHIILTDEDTTPGYVRLQIVRDKCPPSVGMCNVSEKRQVKIDRKGKIYITNSELMDGPNTTRNGPANTILSVNGLCQNDFVYPLMCRQIPRSANSWLQRTRTNDWPSQKQLKTMGSYGCFLVGVGHPHSINKSIEWRISFSLQERDLVSSLNETQHKCYILLKIIKKDIIESKAGESISSYHCKTSLFYTIENSQRYIWNVGNLILCTRMCLIRLLNWVKAKHCPNYFIPEENMFDKLSPMTLTTIEMVLNDIIDSGVRFLYSLTCDNVGELLKSKICDSELISYLANTRTILSPTCLVCISIVFCVYQCRNAFLQHIYLSSNTCTDDLNKTYQLLLYLQNTNHVTEHTTRDVRMAFHSVIPHVQLHYQQCLFAQFLSRGDMCHLRSKNISSLISETSDCDLISSKLSLASLYIQSEQRQDDCKRILVSCENSLEPYVISVCYCQERSGNSNPNLSEKLQFTDMSSQDFRRHCTAGCMAFLPYQVGLVHATLHYEMFRNVYTQPGSEYEMLHDCWLNWITVDSQVYLYFLQYVFYSTLMNESEQETAVHKLLYVLTRDNNLGHKETAFNLLGWICLQENDLRSAWRFFCLSWKIRPFKNAAKWHMLILLSELIKGG